MSDLIEQAVFTSADADGRPGYQVVARSSGVCDPDARELAVWGPSHDALLQSAPNAASFNFHPLPSGNYCLSRTTPAGWEYSGRGAIRVYTQCLIVPPQVLLRFANNPFALLRAAMAGGMLRVYPQVPRELPALRLPGKASLVDVQLLTRLAANPGPRWMSNLVETALDSVSVALAGGPPAEHLIAGLINCLPLACRTEFSFSTGLRYSSQRPFRLVALSSDMEEQRRVERTYGMTVLRVNEGVEPNPGAMGSWSRLIARVLRSGRINFLSERLAALQLGTDLEGLPLCGLQLLEDFDAESISCPMPSATEPPKEALPSFVSTDLSGRAAASEPALAVACECPPTAPSKVLDPDSPEVLAKLEELDDLVYESMGGGDTAIERLQMVWPKLREELGDQLLAESREQYLRYALSIWEQCAAPEGARSSARTARALDVLCLLFDEVP